ncbi:VOC family protein [Siccirubricoccus sp. KC 17139]|uniref:Bleomycin resistance protein n=1 Tax=Siccirubricoccus soli TaxID=2899147 RepID=A0ABT1D8I3_9PROT|nr:VOC family protein [Siccirubricoccus soli]MCO6418239.1 VOC family protein [Siccirubricoccus soli]MCP2684374.1 VOC family protein [Siccirubricoccus soli]
MRRPALVPELMVTDIAQSLAFWCGPCGFRVLFDRPEDGFACLERDGSRLMLDELPKDRPHRWEVAPTTPPFGRHVNFEMAVDALDPILAALAAAGWPLFMPPETKSYRVGDGAVTVRQFLVQDPDGYLLRFSEALPGA